jgi:hypothetical protein
VLAPVELAELDEFPSELLELLVVVETSKVIGETVCVPVAEVPEVDRVVHVVTASVALQAKPRDDGDRGQHGGEDQDDDSRVRSRFLPCLEALRHEAW